MVAFGGWEMPLEFGTGTVAEHLACRQSAAIFDVSHLGTVRVVGAGAQDVLQRALTNNLGKVAPGRAQYTHLLDEQGSVLDDLIVWWVSEQRFDVMPNASNTSRVLGAIGGRDVTAERAVLALQGPASRDILGKVFPEAAAVGHFRVTTLGWRGADVVVAGTGYTGEDGVECAVPAALATELWETVVAAGAVPAGLGPATPSGWKPASPYTATSWGLVSRPWRPGCHGWWRGTSPGGSPGLKPSSSSVSEGCRGCSKASPARGASHCGRATRSRLRASASAS